MPVQVCANKPVCSNLVQRGLCDGCLAAGVGRETRPTAAQRGYGYRWQKASAGFLAGKLCVGFPVGSHGVVLVPAAHTDHIVPVDGPGDPLFWDRSNWQPLCGECHGRKTATEDGGFGYRAK